MERLRKKTFREIIISNPNEAELKSRFFVLRVLPLLPFLVQIDSSMWKVSQGIYHYGVMLTSCPSMCGMG
jgi:hypothetical protein